MEQIDAMMFAYTIPGANLKLKMGRPALQICGSLSIITGTYHTIEIFQESPRPVVPRSEDSTDSRYTIYM